MNENIDNNETKKKKKQDTEEQQKQIQAKNAPISVSANPSRLIK